MASTKKNNTSCSKELLTLTGDRSKADIIKSLMQKKKLEEGKQLNTYKVTKSPLFDQLGQFLPEMKASTLELLAKSEDEKQKLNIENVDDCDQVVEMNLLLTEMGGDSSADDSSGTEDEHDTPNITESTIKLSKCEKLDNRKLIVEIDTNNRDNKLIQTQDVNTFESNNSER